MVDIPDTGLLVAIAIGVLGFFYFMIKRKDDSKQSTRQNTRSDEESELGKEELARKVKKELTDEAEKVEKIRKDVAVDVKQETNAVTDQKLKEQKADFDHKMEMYEERNRSRFQAMDKVNDGLLAKIVDTAKDQTTALMKINDTMEYFRKLLNEMSNKVNRVEKEQDKQEYRE
jgi:hypothetical protein